MVNKVILIGNLGKDPELTYTASGVAVAKCSLATTERWTSKDGQKQEQTEWHNLVFWRKSAEIANQYLRKGSRIYVEGRIKYRQWEGQDGQTRYATDIEVQNFQFLTPRSEGSSDSSGGSGSKGGSKSSDGDTHYEPIAPSGGSNAEGDSFGSGESDDLPF